MGDYQSLRVRLGASDRARVDSHLEHIAEIQRRLELSTVTCPRPGQPPGSSADVHQQTTTMAKLFALGLQCGVTRVFSFMLTSPATTHVFNNLPGVVNDMHTTCHAGAWNAIRDITLYQMQAFALFLDELAALLSSTTSTVLDDALVYGVSEYGEGWKHGVQEMPVVLAGTACGKFRSGWHVREPGGNMAKVHVTMLRAIGLDVPSYGFHGSETSADFGEILV